MRTIKKTLDVVIFEEEDLTRLNLKFCDPIGQFSVLSCGDYLRYVVLPIRNGNNPVKKEYQVMWTYSLNYREIDLENLRNNGGL